VLYKARIASGVKSPRLIIKDMSPHLSFSGVPEERTKNLLTASCCATPGTSFQAGFSISHSSTLYTGELPSQRLISVNGLYYDRQTCTQSTTEQKDKLVTNKRKLPFNIIHSAIRKTLPHALNSPDTPFMQLGADSLVLAETCRHLNDVGIDLTVFDLLELKTLSNLLNVSI
jgi:hypothetical protein